MSELHQNLNKTKLNLSELKQIVDSMGDDKKPKELQCRWSIVRNDVYEFVSAEECTLPQLLKEVTELVEAFDDPSKDAPGFILCRTTPEESERNRLYRIQLGLEPSD